MSFIKRVTDLINEDYQSWKPGDVVVIDAQTGSGKTFFVLNKLLPFVSDNSQHLLYLSNRSALNKQVKLSYDAQYESSILSETYQKFTLISKLEKSEFNFLNADYYVMDEAHYFLDDTAFNDMIFPCLQKLKNSMKNHINIFMTATPEYLLLALNKLFFFESVHTPHIPYISKDDMSFYWHLREEQVSCSYMQKYKEIPAIPFFSFSYSIKRFEDTPEYEDPLWKDAQFEHYYSEHIGAYRSYFKSVYLKYKLAFETIKSKILFYGNEKNYSYIIPRYYSEADELLKTIKETPKDEQWLIFVSSKTEGYELQLKCRESGISDAIFINAESKHGTDNEANIALTHIIEHSRFPNQVVIATKVLDNGINLIDLDSTSFHAVPSDATASKRLRHIAISALDPTQFLQMLGRKRIRNDGSEKIYLYLRARKVSDIVRHTNFSVLRIVQFLVSFCSLKELRFEEFMSLEYKKLALIKKQYGLCEETGFDSLYNVDEELDFDALDDSSEDGEFDNSDDASSTSDDISDTHNLHSIYEDMSTKVRRGRSYTFFHSFKRQYGTYRVPYIAYIHLDNSLGFNSSNNLALRDNPFAIVDIFSVNPLALCKLEYDYYRLMKFIETADNLKYENRLKFSNLEYTLWIQEQLSWLGLEYDPACWLPSSSCSPSKQLDAKRHFESLLTNHCRDTEIRATMSESDQKEFKAAFLTFVATNFPNSYYAKRKASPKTINRLLEELNYPFQVCHEQRSINGKQRNWWYTIKHAWIAD